MLGIQVDLERFCCSLRVDLVLSTHDLPGILWRLTIETAAFIRCYIHRCTLSGFCATFVAMRIKLGLARERRQH